MDKNRNKRKLDDVMKEIPERTKGESVKFEVMGKIRNLVHQKDRRRRNFVRVFSLILFVFFGWFGLQVDSIFVGSNSVIVDAILLSIKGSMFLMCALLLFAFSLSFSRTSEQSGRKNSH